MIPYGKHDIIKNDIDEIIDVLRSDFLTQGPKVKQFENTLSNFFGANHAVAVNSATSALHVACLALDVGPGDTVWTSPNTFVASANCALFCGAEVDFVDINPETWCLSISELDDKLRRYKKSGLKLPKVVIPVHLSGQSCNMNELAVLAKQYNFKVIEDAAHAIGGTYKNKHVGNCEYSDITVFSFHPVKIITTGEGGAAMTNSLELKQRMIELRSHGITRDPKQMERDSLGPWYYEQLRLGFNYRMTDIQAALGISQLKRLNDFVNKRNSLAKRYDQTLVNLPLRIQKIPNNVRSARHLYPIRVEASRHQSLFKALLNEGIGVNLHYMPVHRQPYYEGLGFKEGAFPESEAYGREAITLPLYPKMSSKEQDHVIEMVKNNIY